MNLVNYRAFDSYIKKKTLQNLKDQLVYIVHYKLVIFLVNTLYKYLDEHKLFGTCSNISTYDDLRPYMTYI